MGSRFSSSPLYTINRRQRIPPKTVSDTWKSDQKKMSYPLPITALRNLILTEWQELSLFLKKYALPLTTLFPGESRIIMQREWNPE